MEVGHGRGGKVDTRPEEVVGTLGMVGRTTMEGVERAPILEGT